jgi:ABC-type amino acid transport substrate-binding protein
MFKKLFLIIIILSNILFASSQISLTNKEKLFIKTHPSIVLGTDKGWAPYVISNKNGSITGYDANVLKLINKVSGANFTLKLGKWGDIKQEANNRDIDGLSTAVVRKIFEKKFNFSKPYLVLEKIIFTAKDNPEKFDTLDDLKGKKFGVYKSNSLDYEVAKSIPKVELIEFDSTKELIEGITTGKADAMLGNAAMFYLLNKMGNPFLKPSIFLQKKPLKLVFIVRNDFPEAIGIINKSLDVIGEEKLLKLKNRWFENPNNLPSQRKSKLSFTNKEQN